MSNTTESMNPQDNSSTLYSKYGFYLYIIFLVVIVLLTLLSMVWTRRRLDAQDHHHYQSGYESFDQDQGQDSYISMETSVDESNLEGLYPKFVCSEAHKVVHGDKVGVLTSSLCCSICLGEYKDDEMLRLLISCDHLFHQMCIDPWLRTHPTCPVCRSYSVPNTPCQQPPNLPQLRFLTSSSES